MPNKILCSLDEQLVSQDNLILKTLDTYTESSDNFNFLTNQKAIILLGLPDIMLIKAHDFILKKDLLTLGTTVNIDKSHLEKYNDTDYVCEKDLVINKSKQDTYKITVNFIGYDLNEDNIDTLLYEGDIISVQGLNVSNYNYNGSNMVTDTLKLKNGINTFTFEATKDSTMNFGLIPYNIDNLDNPFDKSNLSFFDTKNNIYALSAFLINLQIFDSDRIFNFDILNTKTQQFAPDSRLWQKTNFFITSNTYLPATSLEVVDKAIFSYDFSCPNLDIGSKIPLAGKHILQKCWSFDIYGDIDIYFEITNASVDSGLKVLPKIKSIAAINDEITDENWEIINNSIIRITDYKFVLRNDILRNINWNFNINEFNFLITLEY